MFLRERRGSPRKKMPHGVEGDTRGKRLNRLLRECFKLKRARSRGPLDRESSELTQQDGGKKRTAKQLCVTNVTGLLPVGFVVIFT